MSRSRETDRATVPRVSVVVPMRDVEDWIPQTIESLRAQHLEELEVLLVDDGSSDGTVAAAERAIDGDPRFRIVQGEGRGAARARNLGIAQARGAYLAFADADDLVPVDAYRLLVEQAERTGAEMVVGNHLVAGPRELTTRDRSLPVYDRVRTGVRIADEPRFLRDRVCWNRIIRASSWRAVGLAFADARRSNDIQAMTHAYCAFAFDVVPQPVYVYRRRVGTSSMTASKQQPGPLRDHFEQELACREAVERLGDRRLRERYWAGILEFDIWAHGTAAVLDPDPAFDEARRLLVDLAAAAPSAALAGLDPVRRLTYALIARRSWEAARAIVRGGGALAELDPERLRAQLAVVLRADRGARAALVSLIRTDLIAALADPATPARSLAPLRGALRAVVDAGLPARMLRRPERALLRLPAGASEERVRAAAVAAAAATDGAGLDRVRAVAVAAARLDAAGSARAVRSLRAGDLVLVARRARPRHARAAVRALARRLGR